ncbi:hypothetical protein HN51_003919 [Arachis hypogaea]|nr:uncharacterized protein LOC112794555 [Arachis hypogaea]QHO37465.1 uncharacterized protein DS421_4g111770 [Arachis hypogaea]
MDHENGIVVMMKRKLQLVIMSLSVVSVFLCCLLSFNYAYFPTFILSIFTHTLHRKYMFLICNAILAFLAKTSSSSNHHQHEEHALVHMLVPPTATALPQEQEEEDEGDEEEEVEDASSSMMGTNNEQVGNEEELNRKFEEFIRKMKQEIRIEAQTHLITV